MADFQQAIKWIKEGKKVRRKNGGWFLKSQKMLNLYKTETGELCVHQEFSIPDFEATDWEIYEEIEKLSDRECNILTNICDLDDLIPTDIKDIKINLPKESMQFRKGFFKDDVKEKIQNAQEIIKKKFEIFIEEYKKINEMNTIQIIVDDTFKEEFGDKLIK
ncbi:hypothetical protein KAI04_04295 [Candidatus Pacearchaeota archaeon]|nr:hypothetical protein [Candidatus Pacearchaeota archaeon]